jgi:hypothetical protein
MSRGRSRHQSSRRRAYHGRQRDTRERQVRAARDEQSWLAVETGPVAETDSESDASAWFGLRLAARAAS